MIMPASRSRPQGRRRRRAAKPDSPTRVYFVGAGLSAALNYPLGRELVGRLMRYLRNQKEPESLRRFGFVNSLHRRGPFQKTCKAEARRIANTIEYFLKRYFGVSPKHLDKINVAEFFTLAHSLEEMPSLFGRLESPDLRRRLPLAQLYHAMAAVTRSYFVDISQAIDRWLPTDISHLIKSLDPGRDALVNFNWDEEIDFAVPYGNICYSLPAWRSHLERGKRKRFLILRPHGCAGWYDLLHGLSNDDIFLTAEDDDRIPRAEKRIISYSSIELPKDLMNNPTPAFDFPPVIMPPTFAKHFAYPEQLQIWRDVLAVCREATEFVFLGYSLPQDDFLTRAAIRSAIRAKSRQAIRCLVVGRVFDHDRCKSFRSVFDEGIEPERNHLPWIFGSRRSSLAAEIKARLPKAVITRRRLRRRSAQVPVTV
jgi:hypothetical protein